MVSYRLYFEVGANLFIGDSDVLIKRLSSIVTSILDPMSIEDRHVQRTCYLAPILNCKLLPPNKYAWLTSTFNLIKWTHLRLIDDVVYLQITAVSNEHTFTSVYQQFSRWLDTWINVGMQIGLISMTTINADKWRCRLATTDDLFKLTTDIVNGLDVNPLSSLMDQVSVKPINNNFKYAWQVGLKHQNALSLHNLFTYRSTQAIDNLYLPTWSTSWQFLDDRLNQRPYFHRIGNSPVVYHEVSLIQPNMWVIDGWIEVKLDEYADIVQIKHIILAMADANGTVDQSVSKRIVKSNNRHTTSYYLGSNKDPIISRWRPV